MDNEKLPHSWFPDAIKRSNRRPVAMERKVLFYLTTVITNLAIVIISNHSNHDLVNRSKLTVSDDSAKAESRKPVCSNFFLHPFVSFRQNLSRTASPCTWPRPRNKNIFLMETYKDFAIPKVLCTLESAARHNSDFCVTLFVSQHDPPRSHWPILQELVDTLPNVEIIGTHPADLVKGTPFENFFSTERFNRSHKHNNADVHYSDIARAALLWKNGGVYVDLDVIVLKSLDRAPQYVARTPHGGIANGILKFHAHNALLLRYMSNIWTDYNPEQYSRLFYVLLETVHNHCLRKGLDIIQEDWEGTITVGEVEECDGVKIFGINSGLFEPFKTLDTVKTIFNETHGEIFEHILKQMDPTVMHYAGNSNGNYRTTRNIRESDSLFARMFRKHCPIITSKFEIV